MSLVKHTHFRVLSKARNAIPAPSLPVGVKVAKKWTPQYEAKEGYIYVRSRAISSRTNDNWDHFPADEIKKAYRSFVGKPVFVNHHNSDHKRARGVIIDAVLHEDVTASGEQDTWVEVLQEIDAERFPKLAAAVLDGRINRTSMGTLVQQSTCTYCGKTASDIGDFCEHLPSMKGQRLPRVDAKTGKTEMVLVAEHCAGLSFFENSLLVEDPADPTAVVTSVEDHRGKTASIDDVLREFSEPTWEVCVEGHYGNPPFCSHSIQHSGLTEPEAYSLRRTIKSTPPPTPTVEDVPVRPEFDDNDPVGSAHRIMMWQDRYGSSGRVAAVPQDRVDKPDDLKDMMSGVTLGEDDEGYYVRTHRSRSKSYDDPHDIPRGIIDDVAATGSLRKAASRKVAHHGWHKAPVEDEVARPMHDVEGVMPDYYDRPDLYRHDRGPIDRECQRAIIPVRGKANAPVVVYRALPVEYDSINRGDWVTPSLSYARQHLDGGSHIEDLHIVSATVPAGTLWNEGYPTEWGYSGPSLRGNKVASRKTASNLLGEVTWKRQVGSRFGWKLTARHPDQDPGKVGIGYIRWYADGEIANIWVDPRFRRQGLGREMFRKAKEHTPHLRHSDNLISEEGRGFAQNVARKTALGETRVPAEVDTLRDENCPVCEDGDYSGGDCSQCGYVKAPVIFHDPDTETARGVDMRSEDVQTEDLACENCGAVYAANSKTAANHRHDEDEDGIPDPIALPDDVGSEGDTEGETEDEESPEAPEDAADEPESDVEGEEDYEDGDDPESPADDVSDDPDDFEDDVDEDGFEGEVDVEDGEPSDFDDADSEAFDAEEPELDEDPIDGEAPPERVDDAVYHAGDSCPSCSNGVLMPKDQVDGIEQDEATTQDFQNDANRVAFRIAQKGQSMSSKRKRQSSRRAQASEETVTISEVRRKGTTNSNNPTWAITDAQGREHSTKADSQVGAIIHHDMVGRMVRLRKDGSGKVVGLEEVMGTPNTASRRRRTAAPKDGATSYCRICGVELVGLDYTWYALKSSTPKRDVGRHGCLPARRVGWAGEYDTSGNLTPGTPGGGEGRYDAPEGTIYDAGANAIRISSRRRGSRKTASRSIDKSEIRETVLDYVDVFADDYDVDAVVDAVWDRLPVRPTFEDWVRMDEDEFIGIVQKFERTARRRTVSRRQRQRPMGRKTAALYDAYADGWGVWHVDLPHPNEEEARDIINDALEQRGGGFVEEVEEAETGGGVWTYREASKITAARRRRIAQKGKSMSKNRKQAHNGWTNWDTWNAALWINNDEGLYNTALEMRSADELRDFIEEIGFTGDGFDSSKVNWEEVYTDSEFGTTASRKTRAENRTAQKGKSMSAKQNQPGQRRRSMFAALEGQKKENATLRRSVASQSKQIRSLTALVKQIGELSPAVAKTAAYQDIFKKTAADAPNASNADAAKPDTTEDVESVGDTDGVGEQVTPDATTTVDSDGTALEGNVLENLEDVTSLPDSTPPSPSDALVPSHTDNLTNPDRTTSDEDVQWTASKDDSSRLMASIRLAKLRKQAGIVAAEVNELELGQLINDDAKTTMAQIETQIDTLESTIKAQASRQQAQGTTESRNLVPRMAGNTNRRVSLQGRTSEASAGTPDLDDSLSY